jgi:hypothetical protein
LLGCGRGSWGAGQGQVGRLLIVLLLGAMTAGCQLAYFLSPEQEKDVKAEYSKLGKQTVAVLVWADQSTLDEDPQVRQRISKAVAYYLKKNLPEAKFVASDEVAAMQRSSRQWEEMSTQELCEKLKCDLLFRIDLLEYTTRAADVKELRKGRVRATISLYEGHLGGIPEAVYESEVVATYPPSSKHGVPDLEDADLLHETIEHFAEVTARKFYDHKESLRGPADR